ncbi:YciI family protein [Kibdelosporangium lantanae]
MKYLIAIYMNPDVWDNLDEDVRRQVQEGHAAFMDTIKASGEFVSTVALEPPAASAVVSVRGGVSSVTDGPFLEAKEFLAGYYLVDCATPERAREVAAMIPDAAIDGIGIEVRGVLFAG